MIKFRHRTILAAAVFLVAFIGIADCQTEKIASSDQSVLDRISADSLKGHLSFIASDALEGRGTPSRGQELAAEYIAAQFRRAGLEPVGDDGYFQTAHWVQPEADTTTFSLILRNAAKTVQVPATGVSFGWDNGLTLAETSLFKVDYQDAKAIEALTAEALNGAVLITEIPDFRREDRSKWADLSRQMNGFLSKARALKPALIVSIDRKASGTGIGSRRLIDPEARVAGSSGGGPRGGSGAGMPTFTITDPAAASLYDSLPAGSTTATLAMKLAPSIEKPVKLRNVVGLLRGSDPMLRDTYVLVTAHYDHLGLMPGCNTGDCIYNGANDDGSGTVSVIELAGALSARATRPKRSLVFMTVFGEERGLLGSRYYGRHPVFPIEKTVADLNLEQVGRTDDNEGPMVGKASITGFDFSDVGEVFRKAGTLTGINVFKHPRNSDAFFGRSDNQALADQGVPAHTLCVAFEYPDYHGLGDHWDKIDYDNFARVNRMVALGLLMLADNPVAPKWNEANSKTERYVKAWNARRPK